MVRAAVAGARAHLALVLDPPLLVCYLERKRCAYGLYSKLNKVIVTVARFVTEQCSVVQERNLKN
jgi:hypothetical protein